MAEIEITTEVTIAALKRRVEDLLSAVELWKGNYKLTQDKLEAALSARPASAGVPGKCTCGQAGHGNGHDADCPLSSYSGPVKSDRQVALSARAGSKPEGDG